MQFLNFTPQEIKALLFLLIALLIGSGITIYKKYRPGFAPELIFKESPPGSLENLSQFNEAPKDSESSVPDTLARISKNQTATPISVRRDKSRILFKNQSSLKEKIDLNSASASQLELLPQIGPVLSQRIINYRETKGQFQKIEDLLKVPGIGPKTFDKIKDLITVR
jgi:comEA protein